MINRFMFVSLFLVLTGACVKQSSPKEVVSAPSTTLVDFNSAEGMERLRRSDASVDFYTLVNQFEAQSNGLYCGPTTAAIVLNAKLGTSSAPKDRSRLASSDSRYLPKDFDPAVARYTQESVVGKGAKQRSLVFGKPIKVQGKEVKDFGYQLRQFNQLLQANGLSTEMSVVDDKADAGQIVEQFKRNLATKGDYVVVNYKRAEVGQQGGGHISPVGAYDEVTQSFLVLDVNPSKAAWVWMPAATLIKGMRSFDTVENRGYVIVR